MNVKHSYRWSASETSAKLAHWIEWLLLAIVALFPWFFGCVHPTFEMWLTVAVAVVLVLTAARWMLLGRVTWLDRSGGVWGVAGLYGLFLVASWQLLPIPSGLVAQLSPSVATWTSRLVPEQLEQVRDVGADDIEPQIGLVTGQQNRLSMNPGGSYQFALRMLGLAALFVAVGSLPSPHRTLQRFSWGAAAVGLAVSFLALLQYFGSPPNRAYWYFETTGGGFGPFLNRNHYPFFMNLTLGLTAGLLLQRYERLGRQWFGLLHDTWSMWLLTALVFMVASLFVCVSRGGIISLGVAIGVGLVVRWQKEGSRRTLFIILAMIAGAAGLLQWVGFELLESRLSWLGDSERYGNDGRWSMWMAAVMAFERFPLFGSGGETYRHWETIFQTGGLLALGSGAPLAYRADNEFLDVLCEYGIVGLAMLLLIALGMLLPGFRRAQQSALATGALMSLAAVTTHSFLDFGLRAPATAVLAIIIASLLTNLRSEEQQQRGRRRSSSGNDASPSSPLSSSQERSTREVEGLGDVPRDTGSVGRMGGIAAGVVLLIVAGVLVAERQRYAVSDRWRLQSNEALEHGDFQGSVAAMQSCVRGVPEDLYSHVELSRVALVAARKASDPTIKDHDIAIAMKHCLVARQLCPLVWEPHVWLAQYVDYLETTQTRLDYLLRARLLHPAEPDVAYATGAWLIEQGKPSEAWPHWQQSLTYSSRHLSAILAQSRKELTSEQIAEQVLPPLPQVAYNAAIEAEKEKRMEERDIFLKQSLLLLNDDIRDDRYEREHAPQRLALAAKIQAKLGENDAAIVAYRRALAHEPENIGWRVELVRLLILTEQLGLAKRETLTVLSLDRENAAAQKLREEIARLQTEASMPSATSPN